MLALTYKSGGAVHSLAYTEGGEIRDITSSIENINKFITHRLG